MGYTTQFEGRFTLHPALTAAQVAELKAFAGEDHREVYGTYGAYCQWVPSDDGGSLAWDGVEKFYQYEEWLTRLIDRFFRPWGVTVFGGVRFQGDDQDDRGKLSVGLDYKVTKEMDKITKA